MVRHKILTQQDILRILQSHHDVLEKYKVRRIALFGSFTQDHQTPESDIDFLVEFEEPTFDNFMGLVAYLEKLFRRKVDVLTPAGLESIRVTDIVQNIKKTLVYV